MDKNKNFFTEAKSITLKIKIILNDHSNNEKLYLRDHLA